MITILLVTQILYTHVGSRIQSKFPLAVISFFVFFLKKFQAHGGSLPSSSDWLGCHLFSPLIEDNPTLLLLIAYDIEVFFFYFLRISRIIVLHSVQFSPVTQSCLTLCDPMNRSTPGLPVHHQLLESTQTHVHRVGDAIQPSILCCPLLLLPSIFPSIRVFSNESALRIRWPKYWSFSFNISPSNEHQDWSPLEWTGWISLQSKGLSRVFSSITVQKH